MLEVSQLTTVFDLPSGSVPAVNDVSFRVAAGETLGLVGESGSGKSVTALSIMRLVQPPGRIAGGHVTFNGRNLLALSESEMRSVRGAEISFIFQEPSTALNPVFTIGDQIAEAMLVHRKATKAEARARAIDVLTLVKVADAADRVRDYPHQLSGGQRQRVLIAMALACRPSLVIADEPTTALDVTIQAQILDLLRDMRAALNLSMLIITHDFGVIAEIADRVAVMYAGRIVEHGPVRDVLRQPKHPYTRGLIASMPGTTAPDHTRPHQGAPRLRAIEGAVPSLGALPSGCAFHPRCPDRRASCADDVPEEHGVGPGHATRCHLYDGDSADSDDAR